MSARNLLETHKRYLEYYLHEHKLSWELIGIGWATNVGLLTVLLAFFSSTNIKLTNIRIVIIFLVCVGMAFTNLIWWCALKRREIYKNALAKKGLDVEIELKKYHSIWICAFQTRQKIREGKHPITDKPLSFCEKWPSTRTSRRSFIILFFIWWIIAVIWLVIAICSM